MILATKFSEIEEIEESFLDLNLITVSSFPIDTDEKFPNFDEKEVDLQVFIIIIIILLISISIYIFIKAIFFSPRCSIRTVQQLVDFLQSQDYRNEMKSVEFLENLRNELILLNESGEIIQDFEAKFDTISSKTQIRQILKNIRKLEELHDQTKDYIFSLKKKIWYINNDTLEKYSLLIRKKHVLSICAELYLIIYGLQKKKLEKEKAYFMELIGSEKFSKVSEVKFSYL